MAIFTKANLWRWFKKGAVFYITSMLVQLGIFFIFGTMLLNRISGVTSIREIGFLLLIYIIIYNLIAGYLIEKVNRWIR